MADRIDVDVLNNAISEYDIQSHISTGGQKAVYRARDEFGDIVVIKFIQISSREAAERADREIEAMMRIDHPTLVNLLGSFQQEIEGQEYFVIVEEMIEGKTLREMIEAGGFGTDLGLRVIHALLDVLCDFNDERIIHRDIKPANIIITPEEEVRLLDVGIARFLTKSTLTPSFRPHAPGTYRYAAPEQLENNKGLQDHRTDLFSAGIVMYESIIGNHPFDVRGLSIPRAILADEKRELSAPDVDQESQGKIHDIYDKLTQHEPYQRYRKPQFAVEDLEEAGLLIDHV